MINYNDIFQHAPHIDAHSFKQAFEEVDETDSEAYPVLVVAAAIHEFSKMINAHLTEFYVHELEKETK